MGCIVAHLLFAWLARAGKRCPAGFTRWVLGCAQQVLQRYAETFCALAAKDAADLMLRAPGFAAAFADEVLRVARGNGGH